MDSSESAIESEVQVNAAALERGRHGRSGEETAKIGTGGLKIQAQEQSRTQDEHAPLLPPPEEHDRRPSADFSHLPWTQRPSVYWVLVPFFLMACAFGGYIAPKMNLTMDLVCREYFAERLKNEPGLIMSPVDFNGGTNEQCDIPEVSARTTMFNLWGTVIAGVLSAITAPKLGSMSDRYGRKPILVITSIGTIIGEIITIFAALYPDTFPLPVLLLSYVFDGITGTFIVSMAIANAYATDCTTPERRNITFSFISGCLFTGLAVGPILAGYIVKWTGHIVGVFYALVAVHSGFALFIGFVVPESVSKKRRDLAKDKHEIALSQRDPNRDWINRLRAMNLLEPLHILRPRGPGSSAALRRNLLVLAAVDTIVFGVAMGSVSVVIVYLRQQFHWQSFETGKYISIVNSSRVICLLILLPLVTRLVKGAPDKTKVKKNTGCDNFDLYVIRFAILFDTIGYLGYTLSRQGEWFILSGMVASLGGVASPTLQSSLTKHVPADRTGQLLGATALLHALARVVSPAVFSAIFAATVGKFDQTVFVCLCATFGMAFIVSWFIRPGVYYDEAHADRHDDE